MNSADILDLFGDFWFPGKRGKKFVGKIVRDGNNMVLEAYISWALIKDTNLSPVPIINGIVNGIKVNLVSAYCIHSVDISSSKKCNVIFSPNEIILGQHYSDSDVLITKLEAKYTDLENWLMRCAFEPSSAQDGSLAKMLYQDKISISDDACEINVVFSFENKYTTVKKVEICNWTYMAFDFNEPVCLAVAQRKAFSFRNLLNFFAGEYLDCYNIKFWDSKGSECCYILNFQDPIRRLRELPYPITYSQIESDIQRIWTLWTQFETEQAPILSLYFEVISNHSRWSNQFLNLVQALEILSCRLRDKSAKALYEAEKQPDKEYPDNTPLYFRLKDLFLSIKHILSFEECDVNLIATRVADTRNYYTHYSKSKKKKSFDIQSLNDVNRFLRSILIALVLKQIGVPESVIHKNLPYFPYGVRWNEVKPHFDLSESIVE